MSRNAVAGRAAGSPKHRYTADSSTPAAPTQEPRRLRRLHRLHFGRVPAGGAHRPGGHAERSAASRRPTGRVPRYMYHDHGAGHNFMMMMITTLPVVPHRSRPAKIRWLIHSESVWNSVNRVCGQHRHAIEQRVASVTAQRTTRLIELRGHLIVHELERRCTCGDGWWQF